MKIIAAAVFVLVAVSHGAEFSVTVPFSADELTIEREGLFTSVHMPGAPSVLTPGSPALPVMPVRVAVPTGNRVTELRITSETWERLPGRYEIQPASGCVPISAGIEHTQSLPDPDIYSRDTWFPRQTAVLSSSSVYWGSQLRMSPSILCGGTL